MSFVEPVSRRPFPHEWSSCPGCGTQPLIPDTAMPWMKKCCAVKNTRITRRIMSVEPTMTRSQRVCPMKAYWNRAKPRATVWLVGSRGRYSRGPMKSFQLLMKGNAATECRHRGQVGLGRQHDDAPVDAEFIGTIDVGTFRLRLPAVGIGLFVAPRVQRTMQSTRSG